MPKTKSTTKLRRNARQAIDQGKVWEQGPAQELYHAPKTPELQQFLGTVAQEGTRAAGRRPSETAPPTVGGVEISHE